MLPPKRRETMVNCDSGVFHAKVQLSRAELDRANTLLGVIGVNILSEEEKKVLGVRLGSSEFLASAEFDDGTTVDLFLESGPFTYHIDAVFRNQFGYLLKAVREYGTSLGGTSLGKEKAFSVHGKTYVISIEAVDSGKIPA